MIYLYLGLYLFIGIGIHAMLEKRNNEPPIIFIGTLMFWPFVIFTAVLSYVFTGKRGGW